VVGPGISEPDEMLVFGKIWREILHEEEALFCRADRGGAEAELGVPVAEVIRKVEISEQTFYRWKKQYVGMDTDQARQMKQLQEENSRLKQLVADLSLDETMLQDVLRRSSKALESPSSGRSSARPVSGERAARLPSSPYGARYVSLP
jgi:putative transposase